MQNKRNRFRGFGPVLAVAGLVSALALLGQYSTGVSPLALGPEDLGSVNARVPQGVRDGEVPAAPDGLTRLRDGEAYGRVPLSFEANRGQTDPQVQFLARSPGYTLFLTSTEAVISLQRRNQKTPGRGDTPMTRAMADVLRMKLVGGNPASRVEGCDQLPGKSNYFIGKDRENWQVNVPTFASVHYQEIYNGVDLVYYGNEQQLENDFVVAPGADPKLITLAFDGAKKIRIDSDGKLLLQTDDGQMKLQKPVIYQVVDGVRHDVAGRYAMRNRRHVGFEVAEYDRKQPLVIDPVLIYSTYLGGSQVDEGHGIATDSAGNAYVTGSTESLDFPTANAAQSMYGGNTDVFITKLNPTGTALIYSTYVGDFFPQSGTAIAVDAFGNAYVTGEARIGSGAANARDVLIVKISSTGALVYNGSFGGSNGDVGNGIAVDSAGNAYLTGDSDSTDFPTLPSAFQTGTEFPAGQAFVTKVNPEGTSLLYSTMIGGSGGASGKAIAADAAGNVYVTGMTGSNDFLISPNAFQKTLSGGTFDAFAAKLNTSGSGLASLVYSTYLGGDDVDRGNGIAVDSAGNAYVAGYTGQSSTYPTTPGAFRQKVLPFKCSREFGVDKFLCEDAFVTKINPTGTGLVYSTLLGGGADERGLAIALDSAGNTYVTGTTNTPSGTSLAYPTTADAFQPALGGFVDAFVTELNSTGTALVSSSYLGGSGNDEGRSIAVDPSRNTYVVGITASTNLPTTANAVQKVYGGPSNSTFNGDVFVAKISSAGAPPPTPTPTTTPTATTTPTPTPTPSPTPPSCTPGNKLQDPGFEASTGTAPITNPFWGSTSTQAVTSICSIAVCGNTTSAVPRNGTYWVWFGGANGPETGTATQTVTIPSGSTATLNYFLRVGGISSPFTDVLSVKVDGATVQTITEPSVAESSYTLRSVNLNAYANGGSHTILFQYVSPTGGGLANFNVDDITLNVVCSTATPTPTPTPTSATVDGKVLTPDSRGLRNATVLMTDSNGVSRTTTTSSFGFFSFDNVGTGGTYTFRITSRLYRFSPRTMQINANQTLPDFVGLE